MSIKINVEIDEKTLKDLVLDHFRTLMRVDLRPDQIKIEVKSKQNYRSEWEEASFRARIDTIEGTTTKRADRPFE